MAVSLAVQLSAVPLGQRPPDGRCVVDVNLHSRRTTASCTLTSCTLTCCTLTNVSALGKDESVLGTDVSVLGTDVSVLGTHVSVSGTTA